MNLDAGTIRIENNAVQVLGRPIRGTAEDQSRSSIDDVAALGD